MTTTRNMEVPDNVLEAIIEIVRLQIVFDPDMDAWILNHYPVLEAWLEGLGRMPPGDEFEYDEDGQVIGIIKGETARA
jgi:hypothetical protein